MNPLPLSAALLVFVSACQPSLSDVPKALPTLVLDAGLDLDGGAGGGAPGELIVTLEPPAPLEAAPSVVRVHATLAGFTFDPTQMALVTGVLTERELTELQEGKVSATLEKRIVPALSWSDGSGEALQATEVLTAGATYTVAMADVPASMQFTVSPADDVPLFTRVWPPAQASGTSSLAVWCGSASSRALDARVATEPGGGAGTLRSRVVPGGAGRDCVRLDATSPPPEPVVAPPLVPGIGRLDPRPIEFDLAAPPARAARCEAGELVFGPGCATVLDDRIVLRSAPVPALWAVAGAGLDFVQPAAASASLVLTGLKPSTRVQLDVAAIDAAGRTERVPFEAMTLPPAPHPVVNEAFAWPLGASPAQEWVEILNDGAAPAVLDGFVLMVGDQATPLPNATLAPGAFALVVSEEFVANDGLDAPPASGTTLLVVSHLGKRGLSKEGETFTLVDRAGSPLSAMPASPKPKQAKSVARTAPAALDGLAGSFMLGTPTPGAPNEPAP